MPSDLFARYSTRLLLDWLNQRFETQFKLPEAAGEAFIASDGEHQIGLYAAPLWETESAAAWEERLQTMEERLAVADGSFLLWVPPGADLPTDEPGATEFVERVRAAAASLAPGARVEVTFPVTVRMAKTREEGGYASVIGGLNRWWTRITENVQGTYQVDSTAVHRLTEDGEARERLWETIGQLSHGIQVGQASDFEVEDAWTLQRLPETETESGFALISAPPTVDPTEGIAVRRTARRRLAAANEALNALDVELRAVALVGIYEYAELETAGATVKALAPSLFSRIQVVCILADGGVRPTFLPRSLP